MDCDNVGDKIELALFNADPQKAQKISDSIKENIRWLIKELTMKLNAKILLIGSDDILCEITSEFYNLVELEKIRLTFCEKADITLSIGIGNSIIKSLVNLNIAKISGKNKIVHS
jgi:hypothetical protein